MLEKENISACNTRKPRGAHRAIEPRRFSPKKISKDQ
jgi:hypothetical protein